MNAIQIVFAAIGASMVDKAGRRPLLVIVNIVCGLCWIGVIVPASIANITDPDSDAQREAVAPAVSKAVLAWVYLFQIAYSTGWTPMQALYPVEVLSYEIRAKGMAFSSLFTSAGKKTRKSSYSFAESVLTLVFYSTARNPVWCSCRPREDRVENIHRLLRLVLCSSYRPVLPGARDQGPHCKSTTTDPETCSPANALLQLEELDDIFHSKNPVKASKQRKKLNVDADANVVHVDDVGSGSA